MVSGGPGVPHCSLRPHLAEPVPLIHEVDPAEVFDPREHGEEPGIGVVELWARQRTASLSLRMGAKGPSGPPV